MTSHTDITAPTQYVDVNGIQYAFRPFGKTDDKPLIFLHYSAATSIFKSQKEEIKRYQDEFIFIKDSNIVRKLKLDDILFAEAMGDYVKLFTPNKFYAVHTKLKIVENRLPANEFLRIHRSYIVALDKIDTLQDSALMVSDKCLPVAITYRKALSDRMKVI